MVLFKKTNVDSKQDKLTAGTNITIADNVISASGGSGSGDVTLDTAQTITGIKTFSNGLNTNLVETNGQPLTMKNSAGSGAAYFKIEQVYKSGYKNWFGLNYIRTTGTTQENLAVMEVRQDDCLYIVGSGGLKLNGGNIELTGATSITGTTSITGNLKINGILQLDGNIAFYGDRTVNMGGTSRIVALPTPIRADEAATKKYVDDAIKAAIKP